LDKTTPRQRTWLNIIYYKQKKEYTHHSANTF
jgi:hypothetical protein